MGKDEILIEGLRQLRLPAEGALLSLLVRYIEEVELFNPAYGLVKVQDRKELVVRHILDSLSALGPISALLERIMAGRAGPPQIADAGSGAGLPGIPLAIFLGGAQFSLIERMGRRAGFLRNTQAALGLANLSIVESDLEELARRNTAQGSYDLIVFRAFRPLEPPMVRALLALLSPGGLLAAYKGRRQAIAEEMAPLEALGGKDRIIGPWEALPLEVPFLEEERHLVICGAP